MATIEDWQKFINLSHEFALVEDDLRTVLQEGGIMDYFQDAHLARRVLFERFGSEIE